MSRYEADFVGAYDTEGWQPQTRDVQAYVGHGGYQKPQNDRRNSGQGSGIDVFTRRNAQILGISRHEVEEVFTAPDEKVYRVNPLAFDEGFESAELSTQIAIVDEDLEDVPRDQLPWYERAFAFDAADTAAVQASDSGQSGSLFIQNPSSYLPVHALLGGNRDVEQALRILDLCAAPGGKTALLAAETRYDRATEIIANDPKGRRTQRLREVLAMQHVPADRVTTMQEDGVHLPMALGGVFDKILVDAECSTDSGINFSAKDPLKGWSLDRIRRMTSLQTKLTRAAYAGLAPGGTMVYSTCTLSPEENEGVIANLAGKNPEAIIQPINFSAEETVRAIRKWNGVGYPERVSRGVLRVFPQGYMDSFCLAVVHKPTGNDAIDARLHEPLELEAIMREVK